MLGQARWLMLVIAAGLTLQSRGEGGIRLPDQPPKQEVIPEGRSLNFGGDHGRSVRNISFILYNILSPYNYYSYFLA